MSTEQQLEILQHMNNVLSNKDSFYLTFTSNKSQFTQKFDVPIKLNQDRKYELALHNFTTTNYQINISEANNKFCYTWNKQPSDPKSVLEQHEIIFEKGAYEVKDIANEIIRGMKEKKHYSDENPSFTLTLKLTTFKSVIEIKRDELRIDFTKPNTVREMLGFESRLLRKGYIR